MNRPPRPTPATLAMTVLLSAALLFPSLTRAQAHGGGQNESGFVPPPVKPSPPPPPPKNIASAETWVPFPGPPIVPQSRAEAKNPPSPPVMFTKIQSKFSPIDWSVYPNDLPMLLKNMKESVDANFDYEVRRWAEVSPEPDKNPILYRTGHFRFSMTAAERAKMRKYLLDGGFILFNTGLGSLPFYRSAAEELKVIFPEAQLQQLSADHPIYHSYYDIGRVDYYDGVRKGGYRSSAPHFDGITINCRTVAVISRYGLSAGWAGKGADAYQCYKEESARRLGVNVMAYATAQRAWSKKAVNTLEFVDSEAAYAGKMFIGQAMYDGEWKTRHKALSILMRQFNRSTDIPVKYGHKEFRLSAPTLFETPLLYITGHEQFKLNINEAKMLRQYLLNGGTVFAEACCGRQGFDASFRKILRGVLPGKELAPVPANHQIFSYPNNIERVGVTHALAAKLKNQSSVRPHLLGIKIDGHYAVIYSRYGLAGGWELSPNPYSHSYDASGATALGQNILLYAITQ